METTILFHGRWEKKKYKKNKKTSTFANLKEKKITTRAALFPKALKISMEAIGVPKRMS